MKTGRKRNWCLIAVCVLTTVSGCAQLGRTTVQNHRAGFRPPAALSSLDRSLDARPAQRTSS